MNDYPYSFDKPECDPEQEGCKINPEVLYQQELFLLKVISDSYDTILPITEENRYHYQIYKNFNDKTNIAGLDIKVQNRVTKGYYIFLEASYQNGVGSNSPKYPIVLKTT